MITDIAPGTILHGCTATYSVTEFLGEGSFGMVVECLIPDTKEIVAVKLLKDPAAIREADKEVCFDDCVHNTQ